MVNVETKNELISAPATMQTATPAIFAAADLLPPTYADLSRWFISQSLKVRLRLEMLRSD